jgi:P4 family phage/plasmid primase-like protien
MFQSYKGTPWAPWLLPIIPVGAKLSANSLIAPDNIGKIPGQFYPHQGVWTGFGGWTKISVKDAVLGVWDGWYTKGNQTIGLQTRLWPVIDADVDEGWQAQVVRDVASQVFGVTASRGRSDGAARCLLLYRLDEAFGFIPKFRRTYSSPDCAEFAVEILGKGQQCLIEGMHPKGGRYQWTGPAGGDPVPSLMGIGNSWGPEQVPRINVAQIPAFVKALDEAFALAGVFPVRPKQLRSNANGGEQRDIGPGHPLIAPNLAELTKALGYLQVTAPEFASREDWENMCRALKTAAGGDETFYDMVYLPWNQENPENEDDSIRAMWDGHHSSGLGWDYVAGKAGACGYIGPVGNLFGPIPDGEPQQLLGSNRVTDVGGGQGTDTGELEPPPDGLLRLPEAVQVTQPIEPTSAGPQGPSRPPDHERQIARRFVEEHGRKDWIYVPTSRSGGDVRHFKDGIWQDSYSLNWHVGEEAGKVADLIRATAGQGNQTALSRATYLTSASAQDAVSRIVRSDPRLIVRRTELDQHRWIMGVPGGYVGRDNALHEPDPRLLITKQTSVRPDWRCDCPIWDANIWRLANNDADQYMALRSAIGYTCSGTGDLAIFFFLYGHKSHEGKTTFLNALGRVLGTYAHKLPDSAFVAGGRGDNRFAFGGMEGAWFAYRGEVEENEEWASASIKEKTSADRMVIERKGVDAIGVSPRHGLWFQGNHLPRFRKPDPGLRRRMIVFDCQVPLPREDAHTEIGERIFNEEGPGILAWCLDARYEYSRNGLYMPRSIENYRDKYLNGQDVMRSFITQNVVFEANALVERHELYDLYRFWRENEGLGAQYVLSKKSFFDAFQHHELCEAAHVGNAKRGPRTKREWFFQHVRLRDGREEDDIDEDGVVIL